MPNQRESFQNLDRDHGVSVFGKSKGKREEEDSSKEPPAGLLRRARSFPWHPIPDSATPSSAPESSSPEALPGLGLQLVLLPPPGPLYFPRPPLLPRSHRPPHWSGARTRQAPPSPPRDEVGGSFSRPGPSGSVRDRLRNRESPPAPPLPPPPQISALSSPRTNPSPGLLRRLQSLSKRGGPRRWGPAALQSDTTSIQ